ncbi:MAG: hypothetical protein KDB85_04180 [Chitinophagales bacterium]|nr:hypothetical protein [Chitinophagales bacterium]
MSNELQKAEAPQMALADRLLTNSQTIEDAMKVATMIKKSGFCPEHLDEGGIIIAVSAGQALGLGLMQSMVDIVPIKGLPTLKGDLIRSLIMPNKSICEVWEESYEGPEPDYTKGPDGFKDDFCHVLKVQRVGQKERIFRFSVLQAKQMGLWITVGEATKEPKLKHKGWYKTPQRMLMYRNIGFAGRDVWGDILRGFKSYEEVLDYDTDAPIPQKAQTGPVAQKPAQKKAEEVVETVELLFADGADFSFLDDFKNTPRDLAMLAKMNAAIAKAAKVSAKVATASLQNAIKGQDLDATEILTEGQIGDIVNILKLATK